MGDNSRCGDECGDLQADHASGKPVKWISNTSLLSPLELLNNWRGSNRLKESASVHSGKMSMNDILTLAAERYLQSSTQQCDCYSSTIHPYGSEFPRITMDETRDVELIRVLLLAADQVASQNYDLATRLITHCRWMASCSGNPVQRLVFYFAEALQEKIDSLTGRITTQRMKERAKTAQHLGLGSNLEFLAVQQRLPFNQVLQIVMTQAILESVKNGTKIHLVDLEIRSGVQWTALMVALRMRKGGIRYLKITAIAMRDMRKVEETGRRLTSFARSMHLNFMFKVVSLSDMRSVQELARVETGETVAFYCPLVLRTMLATPDCLDTLMRAIRRARPAILVVTEVEANHNSPSFLSHFIESLFFYTAFFDSLEDTMERDNQYRLALEGIHFGEGIRNTVAAEGEWRVTRNVTVDVWRAFFARFGMVEIELSELSIYQAGLVLQQFPRGDACDLRRSGNGLIVGWKGTPILSLTTWKFM